MNFIKRLILVSIFISINHSFSLQALPSSNAIGILPKVVDQGNEFALIKLASKDKNSIDNIIGSPYINKDIQPIKVIGFNDKIYSGRYNAYYEQIEIVLDRKKDPITLDFEKNNYSILFINNNKRYDYHSFIDNQKKLKKGLLVYVYKKGNYTLLKREKINIKEKVIAKSGYQKDRPAKFIIEKDVYYIKLNINEPAVLFSKNKKSIKTNFPKNYNEILKYIKSNKIDFKKASHLVKLINYITSVQN